MPEARRGNLTSTSSLPAFKLACRSDGKFARGRRKQHSAPITCGHRTEDRPASLPRTQPSLLVNIALNLPPTPALAGLGDAAYLPRPQATQVQTSAAADILVRIRDRET